MTINEFTTKAVGFVFRNIFQYPRFLKYKVLSNCKQVTGKPKIYQPVQINGKGSVIFHKNVRIGVVPSPFLYSGYTYIDCRKKGSTIVFGEGVQINNNFVAISEGSGIEIGANTLIGLNCEIYDSDFHNLKSDQRMDGKPLSAKVKIGANVFIGSNVKILKGVEIGNNSVIANSTVVTKFIPEGVIAAGVPAKVLRDL